MEKKNVTVKNINGTTTLVCGNCGCELAIPENGQFVAGYAIGKDSGLGTIIAPVAGKGCGCAPKSEACGLGIDLGSADISALIANADFMALFNKVADAIDEAGTLDTDIVRRFLPAHALEMVYSGQGFHKSLAEKGYDYSWKVLLADLRKQAKLWDEKDAVGYGDRNRFYNKDIAVAMAEHYIGELRKYAKSLKVKHCKGRAYVALRCQHENNYQGVFLKDLEGFFNGLERMAMAIGRAAGPRVIFEAAAEFDKVRRRIKFRPDKQAPEFMNAYKAAGAYYTMKDLILFEGCKIKADEMGSTSLSHWNDKRKFIETAESLAKLEDVTDNLAQSGIDAYGYSLLGFLKDFLDYNGFDYDKVKAEWSKQSEMRRAARKASKNRRPRK